MVQISKPVGERSQQFWWGNPDVKSVVGLLNGVPGRDGGTQEMPLHHPTKEQLIDAIRRFQLKNFGVANGRVDPGHVTITLLNRFNGHEANGPVANHWSPQMISAMTKTARATVVNSARSKVGRVSNRKDSTGNREGWRDLWQIFQSAGLHVDPNPDAPANAKPMAGKIPLSEFRAAPGTPGDKGTMPGNMNWCGIFATWALNQAGMNVQWVAGDGICYPNKASVPTYKPGSDRAAVTVGDVCIVSDTNSNAATPVNPQGYLWHHVIIASHPDAKGDFEVVEGNFPDAAGYYQCIVDHRSRHGQVKRNVREIMTVYDVFRHVRAL